MYLGKVFIMHQFFKKHRIAVALLACFFVLTPTTLGLVYAQTGGTSISGDEVCGTIEKKCDIKFLGVVAKNVLKVIVTIGFPILVVVIIYRVVMVGIAKMQGKPAELSQAVRQAGTSLLGFLLIIMIFGGLMIAVLKYFGVKDEYLNIIKLFSEGLLPFFATHAYAAGDGLPNPLTSNNLYDVILSITRLVVRFFIYPAIIVMWVWSGFSFVLAQGKPEALVKARKWLLTVFIITIVVFSVQSFLFAVVATVNTIIPDKAATKIEDTDPSTNNPDTRVKPDSGTLGASCEKNGVYGQIDTTGACRVSGRGGTSPVPSCGSGSTAQKAGTACTLPSGKVGVCGMSESDIWGCYKDTTPVSSCVGYPDNTPCVLPSGKTGSCGTSSETDTRSCYVIIE